MWTSVTISLKTKSRLILYFKCEWVSILYTCLTLWFHASEFWFLNVPGQIQTISLHTSLTMIQTNHWVMFWLGGLGILLIIQQLIFIEREISKRRERRERGGGRRPGLARPSIGHRQPQSSDYNIVTPAPALSDVGGEKQLIKGRHFTQQHHNY